jgi:hypothetical protein
MHSGVTETPTCGTKPLALKGLRDYWLGHAGNTMDDLYDMVKDNAALRKQKAAEYGVGFELPASIVVVNCTECTKKARENEARECV